MPASTTTPRPPLGRALLRMFDYLAAHAVEAVLIAFIVYLCLARGLAVRVNVHDARSGAPATAPATAEVIRTEAGLGGWLTGLAAAFSAPAWTIRETNLIADITPAGSAAPADANTIDSFGSVAATDDPAPHISNLTLVLSPDYGQRKGLAPRVVSAKRQRVQRYLDRYAPAARQEMRDHGIPASITLAQALLESNAGDSKLAVNSNNHFGIKCRAKCLGCTCRNYGDDTRYDMFRVFDSAAASFAEHSRLLNTSRYAKLKVHGTDFRKWAHGLRACGYATDKRYGHKLVKIIENLGLDRYDA